MMRLGGIQSDRAVYEGDGKRGGMSQYEVNHGLAFRDAKRTKHSVAAIRSRWRICTGKAQLVVDNDTPSFGLP